MVGNLTNQDSMLRSDEDESSSSSSPTGELEEDLIRNFAQNSMMNRVQKALHEQLLRTHKRLKQDLFEEKSAWQNAKKKREDIGVNLYGYQKQLARLQQKLDDTEKDRENLVHKRRAGEENLNDLKERYETKATKVKELRANAELSKNQLISFNEAIRQVKLYNDKIKDDIVVNRRATEKAIGDTRDLEKNKISQDIYIDGLYDEVKRLKTEISIIEAQYESELSRTNNVKGMVKEISAELDLILLEKKQLVLQWKSSLVALGKRDEALAAVKKSLNELNTASENLLAKLHDRKSKFQKLRMNWLK